MTGDMFIVIEGFHHRVTIIFSGKTDSECWGKRVRIATSGRGLGGERSVTHKTLNSEAAGHHCGVHFQPDHI